MTDSVPTQWIGTEAIAVAIDQSRNVVDSVRKATQAELRCIRDPVRGGRNTRLLFAVEDVINWLTYHIKLTNAQAENIRKLSETVMPSVTAIYQIEATK